MGFRWTSWHPASRVVRVKPRTSNAQLGNQFLTIEMSVSFMMLPLSMSIHGFWMVTVTPLPVNIAPSLLVPGCSLSGRFLYNYATFETESEVR